MSDTFKHAVEKEYDEIMEAIGEQDMELSDKQCLRSLLSAAYRNTNGDPPEVKIKLMAEVDWAIAKQLCQFHAILKKIDKKISSADCTREESRWSRLLSFIERCRWPLAVSITAIAAFPNGPAIINAVKNLWGGC